MMRLSLVLLCALSPLSPALAQGRAVGELIAAVSGDWDGDEGLDAAVLVQAPEDTADLVVYLNDEPMGLRRVLSVPQLAGTGEVLGEMPRLRPAGEAGFALITGISGYGRTPWSQSITVSWRAGAFVVTGYGYDFYDRLDLSHFGSCSVDLVTQRYTLTLGPGHEAEEIERTGVTEAAEFPLDALTSSYMPSVCEDLFH